jgi:hemerythrin-like domain-containing protein
MASKRGAPMHATLALWHQDHVNFAKLLDLLDAELGVFHDGRSPQYPLLLDIMYYMTHYADVVHHPKEDLVFARVRKRDRGAAQSIDQLTEQHKELHQLGEKLASDLDDVVNGSIVSREGIESDARRYVTTLRQHMDLEESALMPLAAKLLSKEDWTTIGDTIAHIEDPLFGTTAKGRYAALRLQIAREADD